MKVVINIILVMLTVLCLIGAVITAGYFSNAYNFLINGKAIWNSDNLLGIYFLDMAKIIAYCFKIMIISIIFWFTGFKIVGLLIKNLKKDGYYEPKK